VLRDSMDANEEGGGREEARVTKEELAMLERNAKRLLKLSNEILDVTRIEAGTLKLELETVDINEKIRNVLGDMKGLVQKRDDVQVRFEPAIDAKTASPVPLPVRIDRLRTFEVISNLIRNAINFSGDKKDILVMAEKKDGQAVVEVKDRGSGISPEMMPRLFSKFSTDKEKGGTGLGLFIAKNIIEAHGGRIWAENNRDSPGATFAFALPLVTP